MENILRNPADRRYIFYPEKYISSDIITLFKELGIRYGKKVIPEKTFYQRDGTAIIDVYRTEKVNSRWSTRNFHRGFAPLAFLKCHLGILSTVIP